MKSLALLLVTVFLSQFAFSAPAIAKRDDCFLEEPLKLPKPELMDYWTVLKGEFYEEPGEGYKIQLSAPFDVEGGKRNKIYALQVSLDRPVKSLGNERTYRMSQFFDSAFFIKFLFDLTKSGSETLYSTIFIHRTNWQPSALHWSSSLQLYVNEKSELTSLEFRFPFGVVYENDNFEKKSYCLKSATVLEQTPIEKMISKKQISD